MDPATLAEPPAVAFGTDGSSSNSTLQSCPIYRNCKVPPPRGSEARTASHNAQHTPRLGGVQHHRMGFSHSKAAAPVSRIVAVRRCNLLY